MLIPLAEYTPWRSQPNFKEKEHFFTDETKENKIRECRESNGTKPRSGVIRQKSGIYTDAVVSKIQKFTKQEQKLDKTPLLKNVTLDGWTRKAVKMILFGTTTLPINESGL